MGLFDLFKKDSKKTDKKKFINLQPCPWEIDSSLNGQRNRPYEKKMSASKDPSFQEENSYRKAYIKEKKDRELESKRNDEVIDLFRRKVKDLTRSNDALIAAHDNMLTSNLRTVDLLRWKVDGLERNNDLLRAERDRLRRNTFAASSSEGIGLFPIFHERQPDSIRDETTVAETAESTEHVIPDLTKLCSPNEDMNVTLVLGENSICVSKDFLALHSPVFAAMFYGRFMESGKKEVEIKDVVYEEFIDLLSLLYSRQAKILDSTVCHVLDLADRYQIMDIIGEAEQHLITAKCFSFSEKQQLAERYRLDRLMTLSTDEHYDCSFDDI